MRISLRKITIGKGRLALDADPDPTAPLHRQLGIRTCVYRVPVLSNGHMLERKHERRSYDPVSDTWSNDHLFRASVTLAKV